MKKRKYKTGTSWCVWRWTNVDSEYIVRLHILKTPWFAICLHWILKPDPEPYLHDHPVSFLSLILRGGYTELRQKHGQQWHMVSHESCNYIRATPEDAHTIVAVKPNTLTLCFMGPKVREWGFHHPEKWIYWRDYYEAQRKGVQL